MMAAAMVAKAHTFLGTMLMREESWGLSAPPTPSLGTFTLPFGVEPHFPGFLDPL